MDRCASLTGEGRRFAVRLLATLVLAAAGSGTLMAATIPAYADVLPEFDPPKIVDPTQAQAALEAVQKERAIREPVWNRREYDCYDRFLLNRCLSAVNSERSAIELRFKQIDVRARQILRNRQAFELSEQKARDLDDRQSRQSEQQSKVPDALQRDQTRQDDARQNTARRQAEDAQREQTTRNNAQRQRDREQTVRDRQASQQAKREAAAANAEAYRLRQEEQAQRMRDRDEKQNRQKAERERKAAAQPTVAAPSASPPKNP